MSQTLTNDLSDKFGSSDEDDDDEEVVGWIGDTGDFEARSRDHEGFEDDDEDEGDGFGRRGLFHQRWGGDYQDDEFGFRSLGSEILTEEPPNNVTSLSNTVLTESRVLMTKTMRKTKSLQITTSSTKTAGCLAWRILLNPSIRCT